MTPTPLHDTELAACAERWIADVERRGRAANTVAAYRGDLRHYVRMMVADGHDDPRSIGPEDVERFVLLFSTEELSGGRTRADTTVARVLSAVRGLHAWLCDTGETSDDPAADVASPQAVRSAPVELEPDEVATLLSLDVDPPGDPAGVRDRAVVSLLALTGIRPAELVDLDVADADRDARLVRVSGDRPRPLAVPDPRALRAWIEHRPLFGRRSTALFPNQRGERLTRQGVWRIVTDRAVAAGLPAGTSPRVLRNTFAAVERAGGTPEPLLRELLGTAPWSGAAERNGGP